MASNPINYLRTKYIDLYYYVVREIVYRQISKVYVKSGFTNSGNVGKIVILSQLVNARANITILAGFAGFAGLAKSRFFSKSRDFKKFYFLDFFNIYNRPKHSGRL